MAVFPPRGIWWLGSSFYNRLFSRLVVSLFYLAEVWTQGGEIKVNEIHGAPSRGQCGRKSRESKPLRKAHNKLRRNEASGLHDFRSSSQSSTFVFALLAFFFSYRLSFKHVLLFFSNCLVIRRPPPFSAWSCLHLLDPFNENRRRRGKTEWEIEDEGVFDGRSFRFVRKFSVSKKMGACAARDRQVGGWKTHLLYENIYEILFFPGHPNPFRECFSSTFFSTHSFTGMKRTEMEERKKKEKKWDPPHSSRERDKFNRIFPPFPQILFSDSITHSPRSLSRRLWHRGRTDERTDTPEIGKRLEMEVFPVDYLLIKISTERITQRRRRRRRRQDKRRRNISAGSKKYPNLIQKDERKQYLTRSGKRKKTEQISSTARLLESWWFHSGGAE